MGAPSVQFGDAVNDIRADTVGVGQSINRVDDSRFWLVLSTQMWGEQGVQ